MLGLLWVVDKIIPFQYFINNDNCLVGYFLDMIKKWGDCINLTVIIKNALSGF